MTASPFVERIIDKYVNNEELKRLLIAHSRCVGVKALEIAEKKHLESKIDLQFVFDAALLHDIGVVKCDAPGILCFGQLPYICHGVAGGEILKGEGIDEKYVRVCERHTGSGLTAEEISRRGLPLPSKDFLPETTEEKLICYADKFFSKSGDPTQEKLRERIMASMAKHGPEAIGRFIVLDKEFGEPEPRP